uniref:Transmembrane protein 107 n=1 Tax=Caenorhabditis tropicalis TaxID=1561998 RepID=A0A1I7UZQ7_9PELO
MGHFAMSTIVIFDQTAHLEASVIGGDPVPEESRIGFTVCLVLTKLALVIEFASMAFELPSVARSVYSTFSHTVATCLFLLFIYDSHPVSHFWILFALFSVPTCFLAVYALVGAVSRNRPQK